MAKIKEINFDKCNGLNETVESETGNPPQIIQGMAVELNFNGLEVYVKINSMTTEGTKYFGKIYDIEETENFNSSFKVNDTVCFTRDQICSIIQGG